MELFTVEQLIDLRVQAWDLVKDFIGSIMQVLWQNIISFFPALMEALAIGNWAEVIIRLSILVGSIVIIYRFMRKMPLRIFSSMTEV